jgi:hypothetical protein
VNDLNNDNFYLKKDDSFDETIKKVNLFKHYIEDRDNYRIFWDGDRVRAREEDVQIMLDLIFSNSLFSIDKEVNN